MLLKLIWQGQFYCHFAVFVAACNHYYFSPQTNLTTELSRICTSNSYTSVSNYNRLVLFVKLSYSIPWSLVVNLFCQNFDQHSTHCIALNNEGNHPKQLARSNPLFCLLWMAGLTTSFINNDNYVMSPSREEQENDCLWVTFSTSSISLKNWRVGSHMQRNYALQWVNDTYQDFTMK